jgi:hypothetical protein
MRATSKFSVFRREPQWKILTRAKFSLRRKYRRTANLQTQDPIFRFGMFFGIILSPKAAQVFTSEIRLGGLRSSLVTVRGGLRSEQSPVLASLYSPIGSKFLNRGSLQSISTQTSLLRTILHMHNCLIISRSSARSWQLSSNNPMPRRSSERPGRMPGRTAGSAGGKVTS